MSPGVPKYHRIANELRRRVRDGVYPPGETIPAETALAEEFRVSVPTIRQAVSVLRAESLLESRHGRGTFVMDSSRLQRQSRHRYGRARSDNKLLTAHLRHDIVFAGRGSLPEHIAKYADLAPGTEVVIRRRNLYDKETGRPEEVGASYIPVETAGDTYLERPDVVPKALFLCVEDLSGKRYARARDYWLSRPATEEEAEILSVPQQTQVMHVTHVARAEDGTLLEISESSWPANRVLIIDEYDIEQEAQEPEHPSEI
ncbi:GntR family transcriptional regulator [Actinorugispora endophytica]|uniref:GntR family transcriptional regulator n=1 Tax=Actinorugispora endophytica TaxID=1605990 RepID=A0A4R6UZQ8_9ACTN|nr:GntR family transcriptional regulator [Actinorugispora endophytica]TDQ51513.1 GntR family transcriptional regulator [Actinorugispora endophytica]